ncbi:hypothetical protein ABI_16290 [Asticcacaulis biprosthecium C19]|uniref:Uncharacterized protein n=1 Tax=Asticcacaulis biprosthecium C19 TaxID=715226 RepID=F4QJT2_9CAUL|nr:right-handed parallel beta-helix repeat-containing protein [Asticcacaulis biprosthecium]EGF93189.1 hypothetical protein ABI_16290 [Asticcacaulis biprosthecium C19]
MQKEQGATESYGVQVSEDYKIWWKRWHKSDYSWDGLLNKQLFFHYDPVGRHHDSISHQDLYRGYGEELIYAPDGRLFTPLHLPVYWLADKEKDVWITTRKYFWRESDWQKFEQKAYSNFNFVSGEEKIKVLKGPMEFTGYFPLEGVSVRDYFLYLLAGLEKVTACHFVDEFSINNFSNIEISNCIFDKDIKSFSQHERAGESKYVKIERSYISGGVSISGGCYSDLKITSCNVKHIAICGASVKKARIRCTIREPRHCDFSDTEFLVSQGDRIDFRGSGLGFVGAFYTSKIDGGLEIDHSIDNISIDRYYGKFVIDGILSATRGVWRNWPPLSLDGKKRLERSQMLRRLEGGALLLKNEMMARKDEESAHLFYRFELWARAYNPSTDIGTRLVLKIYRWVSRYGNDILRPILWSFLLSFVCSLFYLFIFTISIGWEFAFSFRCFNYFPDAFSFSVGRLAPVLPWDIKGAEIPGSLDYSLRTSHGWVGAISRFVATFQTFVTAVLVFLSALAAKRRFKMSD